MVSSAFIRGVASTVTVEPTSPILSVGLSRLQIFARITLPQTLRLVTLPLTNEWISNFKTATILSYIGIFELFDWARTNIAEVGGHDMEAFVLLTIFYLLVNVTLSRVVTYVERVRRIPGLGTSIPEVGATLRIFGWGGDGGRGGDRTLVRSRGGFSSFGNGSEPPRTAIRAGRAVSPGRSPSSWLR